MGKCARIVIAILASLSFVLHVVGLFTPGWVRIEGKHTKPDGTEITVNVDMSPYYLRVKACSFHTTSGEHFCHNQDSLADDSSVFTLSFFWPGRVLGGFSFSLLVMLGIAKTIQIITKKLSSRKTGCIIGAVWTAIGIINFITLGLQEAKIDDVKSVFERSKVLSQYEIDTATPWSLIPYGISGGFSVITGGVIIVALWRNKESNDKNPCKDCTVADLCCSF